MGRLDHDLIGTWRLLSRIDRDASSKPVDEPTLGSDPLALLFFDSAGNFAAQFMKRDRSLGVATPSFTGLNNTTAIGGYDAYFGTYEVDETSGDVHTRLIGALSPGHVGATMMRNMKVEEQAGHPADHDNSRRHTRTSNANLGARWLTYRSLKFGVPTKTRTLTRAPTVDNDVAS